MAEAGQAPWRLVLVGWSSSPCHGLRDETEQRSPGRARLSLAAAVQGGKMEEDERLIRIWDVRSTAGAVVWLLYALRPRLGRGGRVVPVGSGRGCMAWCTFWTEGRRYERGVRVRVGSPFYLDRADALGLSLVPMHPCRQHDEHDQRSKQGKSRYSPL